MSDPTGKHWAPLPAPTADDLKASDRDRSADAMRAYEQALAKLDEYGKWWRATVCRERDAGLSLEEIAEGWHASVADVRVALGEECCRCGTGIQRGPGEDSLCGPCRVLMGH